MNYYTRYRSSTKIRSLVLSALWPLCISIANGQNLLTIQDSVDSYFTKIRTATKKAEKLWNKDLYGPILLVNPVTRQVYSNYQDSESVMKQDGKVFSGKLPREVNVSGAAISWNGRVWAMMFYPLPKELTSYDRISVVAHELFHVAQTSLGFARKNEQFNNHLEEKKGKIYLRLELEALKKAVQSNDKNETKRHVVNALTFRKYRQSLFPGSDTTENQLELNEGITEYTANFISGRNDEEAVKHFFKIIDLFLKNPTYMRTFAYQTVPVYGYLLSKRDKSWNKKINSRTDLTRFFINAFRLRVPGDLEKAVTSIGEEYSWQIIIQAEEERIANTNQLMAEYRLNLVERPHLEIPVRKINMSFDPSNVMPLSDEGAIYRGNVRLSDEWGILSSENGVLISTERNKISVSIPTHIDGNNVCGEGWTLALNDGFEVIKNETTSGYLLKRK